MSTVEDIAGYVLCIGSLGIACMSGCKKVPKQDPVDIYSDPPAWEKDGYAASTDTWSDLNQDATPPTETADAIVVDKDVSPAQRAPQFPFKGTVTLLGTAPCGASGFITDLDENGIGVCTDFQTSYLFQLTGKDSNTAAVTQIAKLPQAPEQFVVGPGNTIFIGAADATSNTSGWLTVNAQHQVGPWHPFDPVTLSGETFAPSFGKGVVQFGDDIFIATSNLFFDGCCPNYHPGIVERCDPITTECQPIATSGVNPTSLGVIPYVGKDWVGVVNTGPLDQYGVATGFSTLDLINPTTSVVATTIQFPFGGLGIHGEIAVGGGWLAIGSGDNSGRVMLRQLSTLQDNYTVVTTAAGGDGNSHLISLVKISPDGDALVAGDYNTGEITTWTLDNQGPSPMGTPIVVDENLGDTAGISDGIFWNGMLVVAVGNELKGVQ